MISKKPALWAFNDFEYKINSLANESNLEDVISRSLAHLIHIDEAGNFAKLESIQEILIHPYRRNLIQTLWNLNDCLKYYFLSKDSNPNLLFEIESNLYYLNNQKGALGLIVIKDEFTARLSLAFIEFLSHLAYPEMLRYVEDKPILHLLMTSMRKNLLEKANLFIHDGHPNETIKAELTILNLATTLERLTVFHISWPEIFKSLDKNLALRYRFMDAPEEEKFILAPSFTKIRDEILNRDLKSAPEERDLIYLSAVIKEKIALEKKLIQESARYQERILSLTHSRNKSIEIFNEQDDLIQENIRYINNLYKISLLTLLGVSSILVILGLCGLFSGLILLPVCIILGLSILSAFGIHYMKTQLIHEHGESKNGLLHELQKNYERKMNLETEAHDQNIEKFNNAFIEKSTLLSQNHHDAALEHPKQAAPKGAPVPLVGRYLERYHLFKEAVIEKKPNHNIVSRFFIN